MRSGGGWMTFSWGLGKNKMKWNQNETKRYWVITPSTQFTDALGIATRCPPAYASHAGWCRSGVDKCMICQIYASVFLLFVCTPSCMREIRVPGDCFGRLLRRSVASHRSTIDYGVLSSCAFPRCIECYIKVYLFLFFFFFSQTETERGRCLGERISDGWQADAGNGVGIRRCGVVSLPRNPCHTIRDPFC